MADGLSGSVTFVGRLAHRYYNMDQVVAAAWLSLMGCLKVLGFNMAVRGAGGLSTLFDHWGPEAPSSIGVCGSITRY